LLSPTDQTLEYVIGGYFDYSNYKIRYQNNYNFPELGRSGQVHSDFNQNAYTYSLFGQATWHVMDDLRLIGSLRYTAIDKDATYATTIDTVVGAPLRPVTSAAGSISEDNIDPSVTIQYDVAKDVMLYALWGRGSKSGGFVSNTFGTTNATFTFQPEKSQSYEGGVKSTWLEGALIANLSIYRTEFKNLQVTVFDPVTAGFLNRNAGKASSTGVEGELIYKPIDSLTITASGAYQDAKYDDFPGAACLARQTLAQCNPSVPASVAANNIGDTPIPFSSNWTGNLQVEYVHPLTEGMILTTTVATNYRSKYYNADNESLIYGVQPGYAKWDFRVQVSDVDNKWDVALVGKNVFDIKTYAFSTSFAQPITLDPRVHKWLEEPRTISIEASLRL
jgi:iron complex outermembrane receptor protein